MPLSFKPGDKFILEIGNGQLDEYKITGTDYYIKIHLLKKLTQYDPISQKISFINKMKTVFDMVSDEEIEEYSNKPTEDFVRWIDQKYEKY